MREEHVHTPVVKAVKEQEGVTVWRMPSTVSQSRIGGRSSPSNACTVIAVRMAEVIHRTDTRMPTAVFGKQASVKERSIANQSHRAAAGQEELMAHKKCHTRGRNATTCPHRVISCLVNAILDGNSIHEEAVRQRANGVQNFTIPDAIRACKNAVMEVDFCSVPGPLNKELPFYISAIIKSPLLSQDPRLFFLLIAFERSVLIVFERAVQTLTLFDSHMHGTTDGAVIATVYADNVGELCHWLCLNIFHESQLQPCRTGEFELSLIRFCGRTSSGDCCKPTATLPCKFPFFAIVKQQRKRKIDTKATPKAAKLPKRNNDETGTRGMLRTSTPVYYPHVIPLASLDSLRSRTQ